jgi:alkylation response protein AidB-like acyl-CoA dehydrogenase
VENELEAITPAGRELVAMAERFATEFAADAAAYDRENRFPFEHLDALKDSGFMYAPVPVEAGGMGVESVHDIMVATSRLARGDASLTLGVNMHFMVLLSLARQRRVFLARGDEAKAAGVTGALAGFVKGRAAIAAAVSEPDQDLLRPNTTAVRGEDGKWRVNGRKIFSSMAPGATHFTTTVLYTDTEGEERYAYVIIPRNSDGLTVNNDWDAMGMRASGSASVLFEDVVIEGRGPGRGSPAGIISAEYVETILNSGPGHTSAALGVAEAGHQAAIEGICKKKLKNPDAVIRPFVQERAAENSIDLAAARAVFGRALRMIDDYEERNPTDRGHMRDLMPVFAEVQRAKAFVNAAAVRILDRALAMSGGAGYLSANPLSRLYRDARAGAFMHPLGIHVGTEFLGAHTLGLRPTRF